MKKGTCPKCQGQRIGRFTQVKDRGHLNNPAPRMIGAVVDPHFFGDQVDFHGRVEAYVCVGCGYFEEYVQEPAKVPWESMSDFEWVDAPRPPPFR